MSCLGGERIFEYFSRPRTCEHGARAGLRVALVRLNYAVEMRYGVLVDLARKVYQEEAVDLSMGYANVIWQGDASAMALAMLADVSSPAFVLNVTGLECLSVREVCQRFGDLLGKRVRFAGTEAADAAPEQRGGSMPPLRSAVRQHRADAPLDCSLGGPRRSELEQAHAF